MNNSWKNFFVGIFILAAIILLVCTILFLKPSVGDGEQTLYVRLSDINKINIGTRVMFAGRPVGEVVSIAEIPEARAQPTDELGRVYFYQLTLQIDSKVHVFNTDEITIQTSGLLGEKSIAIVPKAPPVGVPPKRITNQPIYANSVDPLENAIVEFSELSGSMEEAFKNASKWLRQHGEEVATSIQSFGKASHQIEKAVASINEQQLVGSIKSSVDQLKGILTQVHSALNELEQMDTFANAGASMLNIKNASQNIELITRDISQGKGVIGRLIVDDELYLSVNAILTKINTLMNDINHYGILFHLNKRWQRLRTQKVNLQNALSTPQTFRAFFETEIDGINTSMERLSMLINEASDYSECDLNLQNEQFTRDFAELLRQADQLSNNLRLYNQQLLDAKQRQ